jgi:phosphatidylserine decarboxylase
MKFAPEGYSFVAVSLFFSGVAACILWWAVRSARSPFVFFLAVFLMGSSLVLVFFMFFFFRDPDRIVPRGDGLFVSPADGKVIKIQDVPDRQYIGDEAREISIFMSPLDVHVNRSPCDGRVVAVHYSPGTFMAAYKDDASLRNENIVMILDTADGKVLVRQVAGFVARRAVCRVREGDVLQRGQRYGIIKFSSRLDVYVPKSSEVMVKVGDRTRAGETVIARAGSKDEAGGRWERGKNQTTDD